MVSSLSRPERFGWASFCFLFFCPFWLGSVLFPVYLLHFVSSFSAPLVGLGFVFLPLLVVWVWFPVYLPLLVGLGFVPVYLALVVGLGSVSCFSAHFDWAGFDFLFTCRFWFCWVWFPVYLTLLVEVGLVSNLLTTCVRTVYLPLWAISLFYIYVEVISN